MAAKTFLRLFFLLLTAACAAVPCHGKYFGTQRQQQVDSIITEYHRVAHRAPYAAGSNLLMKAANTALRTDDPRPNIVLLGAVYDYMKQHNISWETPAIEEKECKSYITRFEGMPRDLWSTGLTMLYCRALLDGLKYESPYNQPLKLLQIARNLENMPAINLEPELQPYYDLMSTPINETEKNHLLAEIKSKLKNYSADEWLLSGVSAILMPAPEPIIDAIYEHLKGTDPAAADALQGYYYEKRALNGETFKRLHELYESSAGKKNVLGSCRYADLVLQRNPAGALEILAPVENHVLFTALGGTAVKADALSRSDSPDDVREAARLAQIAAERSFDSDLSKNARDVYNKCQARLAIFDLQEQERQLDIDEALPSEIVALAKGYESVDGYEDKAMELYRIAADYGDEGSLCRVCIYDIEQGTMEEDGDKVTRAANTILEHAGSDFLPFRYNAIFVLIYGLNGHEPGNAEFRQAAALFDDFKNKYAADQRKSLYTTDHFFCLSRLYELPGEESEFGDYFDNYDKAMSTFREGLAHEQAGEYSDAATSYYWTATWKHPLAHAKEELMHRKWKEQKERQKEQK